MVSEGNFITSKLKTLQAFQPSLPILNAIDSIVKKNLTENFEEIVAEIGDLRFLFSTFLRS